MIGPITAHRGPANHGDVAAATPGLVLAAILAALAGMVDVIGYLHLNGLFVSFMSGNSTQLAAALGRGDLAAATTIAELIALRAQQVGEARFSVADGAILCPRGTP